MTKAGFGLAGQVGRGAVSQEADLAQLMQLRLALHFPDGREASLRLWDLHVLVGLVPVLDEAQRLDFFAHIEEWHLLQGGHRAWIGRPSC